MIEKYFEVRVSGVTSPRVSFLTISWSVPKSCPIAKIESAENPASRTRSIT